MNVSIIVAAISAVASVGVASATFVLNKRAERATSLRHRKQEQYHELLKALAALCTPVDNITDAKHQIAIAINMVALVAPQYVVSAAMAYYRDLSASPGHPTRHHQRLLSDLILKLRESLELPFVDDPKTFDFDFGRISET